MGMAFPTENKGRWGDNHTWATIHDGRVCLAMWYLHPKMIRHSNFSKWVCAYRSQPIIFHQISRRLNIFVFHQEKVRILTPDGFWLMRMKEKHDATNFFVTSKNNHGDLPTKRSCINNNVQYIWGSNEVVGRFYFTYCGWKKSCTTLDGWNPINNGVNHLSTGAGFLPSTVCHTCHHKTRFLETLLFEILPLPPFWHRSSLPKPTSRASFDIGLTLEVGITVWRFNWASWIEIRPSVSRNWRM